MKRSFVGLALVLAACSSAVTPAPAHPAPPANHPIATAGPPLEPFGAPASIPATGDALLTALGSRLPASGDPDAAGEVDGAWRWRPAPGAELLVYVACRGAGDTRGCVLAVAQVADGSVTLVGAAPAGWDPPTVALGADATDLAVTGQSGRGDFGQDVHYRGGAIVFDDPVWGE